MFENLSNAALNHAEPAHAAVRSNSARAVSLPRIDSGRLLAGGHEIVIDHAGQEYRLRLTRNDKLILTK